jgi:hypothetical protein
MMDPLGRLVSPPKTKKNDMKNAVKLIALVAVVAGGFVANSCCSPDPEPAPVYVAPAK